MASEAFFLNKREKINQIWVKSWIQNIALFKNKVFLTRNKREGEEKHFFIFFLSAYCNPLLEMKNLRIQKDVWPLEGHTANRDAAELEHRVNLSAGFHFGGLRDRSHS